MLRRLCAPVEQRRREGVHFNKVSNGRIRAGAMKGRRRTGLHIAGQHLDTRFYSCHKPSGEKHSVGGDEEMRAVTENESEAKITRRIGVTATLKLQETELDTAVWLNCANSTWSKQEAAGTQLISSRNICKMQIRVGNVHYRPMGDG